MGKKVAVVTGGTSGIGRATALALRDAGYTVYTISRHDCDAEGMLHLKADVTDEQAVGRAVGQVIAEQGKIDLLVNNAGFGISGAVEFTQTADAKRQFDTNFFGMVNLNHAVIPHMRTAGGGRIINISSVAASIPIPFQTYYSATKAAVNAYTLALANELRPFHIGVCAVQPGDIRTGFTAAREKTAEGDAIYGGRIGRSVARMERDEQRGMPPEAVGRFVARVARQKRCRPICTVGIGYRACCLLVKLLPRSVSQRLVGLLYSR